MLEQAILTLGTKGVILKTYHSREFLTSTEEMSWAAVHCFHGFPNQENQLKEFKGKPETLFVLQGCHNSVTLHKTSEDIDNFILKLRKLSCEIDKFANWLEQNKEEL